MNFKNAKELLLLCEAEQRPISEVMIERECTDGESDRETVLRRMHRALEIMKHSANAAAEHPAKSMGGLIGGEANRLRGRLAAENSACGTLMTRGIMYAMSVLEVNAGMGLIVAAPTAGSSGVVPGVLISLQDEYGFSDDELVKALFNAGAVGYLAMRNATVAGAVGGCQAEVGMAAAMAASAAVEAPAEEDSAEEVPAEHHFTFKVVDAEGNEKTFDIATTETNVGEALLKEGLIAGDSGPYGIYVKQVNGITADYDTDGTYWAFYIDGEMAMAGVDATDITDGAEYMFKVES